MAAGDPVVPVTNFELLRILAGAEMQLGTLDGGHVIIRLSTPQELIAAQRRANAAIPGPQYPLSLDKAAELCQPVDVAAAVQAAVQAGRVSASWERHVRRRPL